MIKRLYFLQNEMADHVMEVYLSNKDEIDARLLRNFIRYGKLKRGIEEIFF